MGRYVPLWALCGGLTVGGAVAAVIATMRDPRRSAALEAAVGSALGRTLRVERLDVNCEKSVRECMCVRVHECARVCECA